MFSIKAVYRDKSFVLTEPLDLDGSTKVILTLLGDQTEAEDSDSLISDEDDFGLDDSPFSQDGRAMRAFPRYQAKGELLVFSGNKEIKFRLIDYSKGGLGFFSIHAFEAGTLLRAAIPDPIFTNHHQFDFDFEVARSIPIKGGFQIGCRFAEEIDLDLWHSIASAGG
ncbi:MAG: hypothetical protein A2508_05925 [Candidatus Lambdaproteobacteria bacterium RIFOXYD12_FULL_49_8]|uniref:PilZ domain-containing protein n=1 Tax=Candidatus Lambdaproteobacteria bacterium RIFOXYD2_FULL_50_16 TaxID=1817772 RepID=A0A1F6GAH1_9PROT|nr:MAG: hypothetical protein A2527_07970 [Candidatus Lambdaproteobacteria bacterium RIFOXYD2_FULL_50_16]OGG98073.1 MAG: hypothetical protein A2508_05925 [Candidatus Lambdaproteobacteria bacterium RIFOXYD12_FULL_49_8]